MLAFRVEEDLHVLYAGDGFLEFGDDPLVLLRGGLPALRSTTLPSGSKVAKFPLKATSPSRKSAPRPKALKAPRPTT